jgi:ABC-type lipoprotein release transport system permease subunit
MMFSNIKQLARIALRNLARHKVKSALSILAITVSVMVYIVIDGWLAGMTVNSKRNIVSYETGAAKLQTKMYFEKLDDLPMYENFDGWERYTAALDKAGYTAVPRFVFSASLYSKTGSAPVTINAIDPALDPAALRLPNAIDAGRFIQNGAFEIVLGTQAAEKLKAGIPARPTEKEFEGEILPLLPPSELDFVSSLYEPSGDGTRQLLKRNITEAEKDRYWALLADTGRMNVRISVVIDIKAPPDAIRLDKFTVDLEPFFTPVEAALFCMAYEYDELTGAWLLISGDEMLLNDVLTAMVRVDYSGAIRRVNQLIDAVVVGTINAADPVLNGNMAFIPLDVLQDDAGLMLNGKVTELIIREKNAPDSRLPGKSEAAPVITAALQTALGGPLPDELGIFGWEGYAKDFIADSSEDNWSFRIVAFILFILSFLGIANTMLLAILERTKETGMMRAQGMTDKQLVFTMMLEAGFIGLIGSAIGILIACLINIPMVNHGLDFSAIMEASDSNFGWRVNGTFRSAWNIPVIIGTGIVATVLSSIAAFIPTRHTLTLPVTESLRFE